MFKKIYITTFLVLLSVFLLFFNTSITIKNDEKIIFKKVRNMLMHMHVSLKRIDDNFSKEVFIKYLEELDPYKRYFKQSDFNDFKKYENKIDDYFMTGNFDFYILTLQRYFKRVDESEKIIYHILNNPISLDIDEYLILDEKLRRYADNDKIYYNEWKKFVKNYILMEMQALSERKKNKNYNLNLKLDNLNARHNFIKLYQKCNNLSFNRLKNAAIIVVKETMKDYFRKIKARKKNDYFSIYLNAIAETFDPHTMYFSPKDAGDFHSNISGKIIGIGAKLQDIQGYPVVSEIIIGGPVSKSKDIEVGDKILKVGEDVKKLNNVVGLLLEDTIEFIRGKEESQVFLLIQKKDGRTKLVSLIREKIELDNHFIKSVILKNDKNEKFGVIYLPEFYTDLENPNNGRHCFEDFQKEVLALKKENIKGLVVDLRGNGGGSLSEVVKIVGLFIPTGPILKVSSSNGYEQIYQDRDVSVLYDGSLVVIVDEFSASASEIFAAAIQDYKRGIILGSYKTFGKGTVQSVLPLDEFGIYSDVYGFIKITVQKFYRINGSSTQIKGVIPDIVLTSPYQYLNILESNQKHALPWDSISSLHYIPWHNKINYDFIKYNSQKRIKNHPFLIKMREKAKWLHFISEDKKITLHYKKFKQKFNIRKKISEKYDRDLQYKNGLIIITPKHELLKIKKNIVLKYSREKWYNSLLQDFYINESISVLSDFK